MEEIGPVDYLAVAFPGNRFKGEIATAIAELVDAGTIRVIWAILNQGGVAIPAWASVPE